MNDTEISDRLAKFPLGNLCNADPSVKAMYVKMKPLFSGIKIAGPAKTARTIPGQNAAIHRAAHTAKPGEVLVVDCSGDTNYGPFGDILATCLQNQGVKGIIIDSTVRDSADLEEMAFPVFCLGTNPTATVKTDPGQIDVEINCGGVSVNPGDFIVADGDGVVVVPKSRAGEIIEKAEAVVTKEEEIKARLANGETTLEIFELEA